jgi:hypothetical protein
MRNIFLLLLLVPTLGSAGALILPDPLATADGGRITDRTEWERVQRPQTLELFRTHVYGRMPLGRPADFRVEVIRADSQALEGMATVQEVEISFSTPGEPWRFRATLVVPNGRTQPSPAFILISHRGPRSLELVASNAFWPVRQMIERGYATIAFDAQEIDSDRPDGYQQGVRAAWSAAIPGDEAWGTIAAWAWGASRVMDYLEQEAMVDARRVAVVGHSRGGKAALWAGAEDARFALVISNQSGCTGAALARRKQGERIADINRNFPHWFAANYHRYNGRDDELPVDQHQLVALIAPRLAYIGSATLDTWADPEGEFLSGLNARPVYRLYDLPGLPTDRWPAADEPVHEGTVAYHVRTGGHGLGVDDWRHFLDFADRHWAPRPRAKP